MRYSFFDASPQRRSMEPDTTEKLHGRWYLPRVSRDRRVCASARMRVKGGGRVRAQFCSGTFLVVTSTSRCTMVSPGVNYIFQCKTEPPLVGLKYKTALHELVTGL